MQLPSHRQDQYSRLAFAPLTVARAEHLARPEPLVDPTTKAARQLGRQLVRDVVRHQSHKQRSTNTRR